MLLKSLTCLFSQVSERCRLAQLAEPLQELAYLIDSLPLLHSLDSVDAEQLTTA